VIDCDYEWLSHGKLGADFPAIGAVKDLRAWCETEMQTGQAKTCSENSNNAPKPWKDIKIEFSQ